MRPRMKSSRIAFPHLPEKFARGTFIGKRAPTIYKSWTPLAVLNKICAERSSYMIEEKAPNGMYLLRTPDHEHEIDRLAHQWWQTGTISNERTNCGENDHAFDDPLPVLPDGVTCRLIWFLTRMYARSGVKEGHPDSGRDSGCSSSRYGTRTLCG